MSKIRDIIHSIAMFIITLGIIYLIVNIVMLIIGNIFHFENVKYFREIIDEDIKGILVIILQLFGLFLLMGLVMNFGEFLSKQSKGYLTIKNYSNEIANARGKVVRVWEERYPIISKINGDMYTPNSYIQTGTDMFYYMEVEYEDGVRLVYDNYNMQYRIGDNVVFNREYLANCTYKETISGKEYDYFYRGTSEQMKELTSKKVKWKNL